ncbi:MAG: DUF4162 domain-containing protein, partial [Nitrososphaerota archaeon]
IYAKIFGIPRNQREKIIDEALENMGLSDVKKELVRTYSGGMIRRLEIACAVLIKPKVMFLDEPTIGLDPAARKTVWERLKVFKEEYGVTIFFNTHYMDEADMYADKIAIINQGKIVTRGTSRELKQSLGGDVITFILKDGANNSGKLQEIKKLEFVKNLFVYGSSLSIVVENAEIALPSLLNTLRDIGASIEKISIAKPTLDDVFLKYAGTRLEDKRRLSEVTRVREMIRRG